MVNMVGLENLKVEDDDDDDDDEVENRIFGNGDEATDMFSLSNCTLSLTRIGAFFLGWRMLVGCQ